MQDFESELVLDAGENRLMIQCRKVTSVRFHTKDRRVAAHGVAAQHTRQSAIIAVLVELPGRQDAEEARQAATDQARGCP